MQTFVPFPRTVRFWGTFVFFALIFIPARLDAQQSVDVNLAVEHQTMDGNGGNAYGFITGSSWSPTVVNLITQDINVTHIRVRSTIGKWEPSNDNGDPGQINWSAFYDGKQVHEDFVLLKKLSDAGIECILGIWDVPDWMVLNPHAGQNRIIPDYLYPEFAELIASYIIYARNNYDANIHTISLQNEPNIGIYNYFSPDELADVSEVVLSYLDHFGLNDVNIHVGDVNEPNSGITYFKPSLDRPVIAGRTAAVSYHTWHNMTAAILGDIRDFAKSRDVPSWATEVGTAPLDSTTMDWALGSMKNHHYALNLADSTMSFQWSLAGAESSISKSGSPYPVYYGLKHFFQHTGPGSIRVGTQGDTGSLFTTAFKDKAEKRLTIVTTNTDSGGVNMVYDLKAPTTGYWPLSIYKTTASSYYQDMGHGKVQPDKTLAYYLEGRSFHTFNIPYNQIPQVELDVAPTPGNPVLRDYTFTLTDRDGIEADMNLAGIRVYAGSTELLTVYYDDPVVPGFFNASIDLSGEVLTMKLEGIPQNLGMLLLGGGVDVGGGAGITFTWL